MKPIKLVLISVAVLLLSLVFILSCDTTKAEDPTEEDIQKLGAAMDIAFSSWDEGEPPPGITLTGDPDTPGGVTITFTNYTNAGVTVNGSLTMSMTSTATSVTMNISGTLNFTGAGAPAGSVGFNVTISIDMSDPDPNNWVISISGTFSIDGTTFNATGIENMVLFYFS